MVDAHTHAHTQTPTHWLVCFNFLLFMHAYAHRENFALENMEGESQARVLLDQTISQLQSISKENPNVVVRMKLKQISKVMVRGPHHSEKNITISN